MAENPFTCMHNHRGDMEYEGASAHCRRCDRTWARRQSETGFMYWWTEPAWPKVEPVKKRSA